MICPKSHTSLRNWAKMRTVPTPQQGCLPLLTGEPEQGPECAMYESSTPQEQEPPAQHSTFRYGKMACMGRWMDEKIYIKNQKNIHLFKITYPKTMLHGENVTLYILYSFLLFHDRELLL